MTNADCTLYKYNATNGGYTRYYINGVYWRESKGANVVKSGMRDADGLTVHIFSDAVIPSAPRDMLVKGTCDFSFNNASQQTISASMKSFASNYTFFTVSSVDNLMFGGLKHIEVSAK